MKRYAPLLLVLLLASLSLAATVPRCPQTPNLVCIDGTTPLTADWSLGSHKITSMTDPTAAQDAATKNYADTKFGGVAVTYPGANAAGALHNDGAGVLSWIANGAAGGGLPAGTTSHLLRFDGSNWVDSAVLQNNGTDVTDTGKLTVQGLTSKFGTAGTSHTMDVGQSGVGNTSAATLRIRAGDSTTAAIPKIQLMRNFVVGDWYTDGTSSYFDYVGSLFYGSISTGSTPLTLDANGNMGIANTNVPYTAASGLAGISSPAFNVGGLGTAGAFQVDQTGNVTSAAYVAGVNTNTAPVLSYVVPTGYVLEPPRGTQRLVGAITARSVGTARTRLRNEVRAFLTAVNTGATLLTKSYEMPPAFLFTYTGTQRLVGPITARMRGSARTRGRDDTKNIASQAIDPGSITIGDGEFRVQPKRLRLVGNGRLTIKGKGFLRAIS